MFFTSEKPTAGFVLSLIGGIIILLIGLAIAALAALVNAVAGSSSVPFPTFAPVVISLETIGIIGIVTGLIVIVGGVMMYVRPQQHVVWGVLVLVISILSIFGGAGAILGIVFKPAPPMMAPPMAPPAQ